MSEIFISIGNRLFRSPVAARFFKFNDGFMSRACFSSIHQPQKSENWVDDIRKEVDNYEDGRSDISWDGFKETTKNVKDTVVGNDDDHSPVSLSDDRDNVDSHVHNLRKRAGGYDLQEK